MQSTLRPTRLTMPAARSSSCFQSPSVRASHGTCLHAPATFGALRDSTTTEAPRPPRYLASEIPRNPDPPAITTRPEVLRELTRSSLPFAGSDAEKLGRGLLDDPGHGL